MKSVWSPKMEWWLEVTTREATCMTLGRNWPPMAYMAGIISIRPWEEVKVVVRAPACREPWQVPAAPASDCIWMTSTVEPNRFFRPLADHSSTFSAMGEEGVMG